MVYNLTISTVEEYEFNEYSVQIFDLITAQKMTAREAVKRIHAAAKKYFKANPDEMTDEHPLNLGDLVGFSDDFVEFRDRLREQGILSFEGVDPGEPIPYAGTTLSWEEVFDPINP